MVITTISCDAVILRCPSCQLESAAAFAIASDVCRACGDTMMFDRRCEKGYSLHRDCILIRCIAENKDGWCCEDKGGRDFCPDHVRLADPKRIERSTPRAIADL